MSTYQSNIAAVSKLKVLARFYRPTKADIHQEALWYHRQEIPLPVRLDGRSAAL